LCLRIVEDAAALRVAVCCSTTGILFAGARGGTHNQRRRSGIWVHFPRVMAHPCRDITAPHSAFAARRYFHSARHFYQVALLRTTGSTENHHIALKRVFLRQRVKCVDGRPLSAPMNGKGRIASVGLGPLRDITPTPPRGEHPNRRLWHQSGRGRHAA